MTIDRIEIRALSGTLDRPFGWSQRWTNTRGVGTIQIFDSDGASGWGEAGADPQAIAARQDHYRGLLDRLRHTGSRLVRLHQTRPTSTAVVKRGLPGRLRGFGAGGVHKPTSEDSRKRSAVLVVYRKPNLNRRRDGLGNRCSIR